MNELVSFVMLNKYPLMACQQKKFNTLMESYKKKKGKRHHWDYCTNVSSSLERCPDSGPVDY